MDITADELINMFDMSIEKIGTKEGICKFLDILACKKCQGEFKSLLNGIVKELQKEMGLPLNSFSGICSKYVLLKYYGVPDREFDKHVEGYLFQKTESVSYFLGELFEVLDKTCDKLKNGYTQVISSLIAMEPGIESEEMVIDESPKRVLESKKQSEKLEKSIEKPILTTERDLPEGSDGSDTSASVLITQPIRKTATKTTKKVAATIKKESVTPVVPPKSSLLKRLHIKVKEARIYNSEKNM